MKVGSLIKMRLNETCNKVHIGKHLSDIIGECILLCSNNE
jgi:hypothetical protein